MRSPKINKGPEKYTVVQLRRLADEFLLKNNPLGLPSIDQVVMKNFFSWLEEQ